MTSFCSVSNLCFHIGEYKVQAIKNEIIRREESELKGSSYNADGSQTVCIGGRKIELSILEVSSRFGRDDDAKTTQDHIKGGFGVLALLQEIAYVFKFGNLETFEKIRVFFFFFSYMP